MRKFKIKTLHDPNDELIVEVYTFDELVQYGKDNGANIVGGMPWSFNFHGHPITHENDQCYLLPPIPGTSNSPRLTPNDLLVLNPDISIEVAPRELFELSNELVN